MCPLKPRMLDKTTQTLACATAYGLQVRKTEEEWARLKRQYDGFHAYLGGKLTPLPPASLGEPKRILDLGTGAGTWAAQAAQEYPDAEVIAVDIGPLPPSFTAPANTHITHILNLLAPGGHFVSVDLDMRWDHSLNTPILVKAAKQLEVKMEAKDVVPHFAAQVGGVLRATRAFDEIAVKTVTLPFNASLVLDPTVRALTEVARDSTKIAVSYWYGGLVDPAEYEEFLRETSQPGTDWYCEHDIVFTWSRKKL